MALQERQIHTTKTSRNEAVQKRVEMIILAVKSCNENQCTSPSRINTVPNESLDEYSNGRTTDKRLCSRDRFTPLKRVEMEQCRNELRQAC